MQIDVTDFVRNANHRTISGSIAELGDCAARITWANAKKESHLYPFLSDDNREEFEKWLRGFGAWAAGETAEWSLPECNALLLQFISGDVRELAVYGVTLEGDVIDVAAWEDLMEGGSAPGRLYPGDDARVYYYIGE